MDTSKEKICHILQFIFDKGENASQAAQNVNSVYGSDTVTANQAQFWFRRFYSGNFDVKDAPRSGRPIVENVDKIMQMSESDRHISTVSIAQELNIAQKTVWNHLEKAGYKKAGCVGATRVNAKKPHGPNFHLWIAAESQQSLPISEADSDWRWKVDHLRQRQAKTVVIAARWAGANGGQARIDGQEGIAVRSERLARN